MHTLVLKRTKRKEKQMKPYVISLVPMDMLGVESQKDYGKIYYCHHRNTPNIPVLGSIGSKRKADKTCKMLNYGMGQKLHSKSQKAR